MPEIDAHPTYFGRDGRLCRNPVAWTAVVNVNGQTKLIAGASSKRQALRLGVEAAARMTTAA